MSPRTEDQLSKIRSQSIDRILNAAFELMAAQGYDSTSIAQIAQRADISKGLLYNYFNSKEDLLIALVDRVFAEGDRLVASVHSDNPALTLQKVFNWFFKELRDNEGQWRLLSSLALQIDKFPVVQDLMKKKMDNYVHFLEQLLSALHVQHPLDEARTIAALFDGIGFQYLVLQKAYPLAQLESYLINKYCHQQ